MTGNIKFVTVGLQSEILLVAWQRVKQEIHNQISEGVVPVHLNNKLPYVAWLLIYIFKSEFICK